MCPWWATPFIFLLHFIGSQRLLYGFSSPQLRHQIHLGKHNPPLYWSYNSGCGLLYVGVGCSARLASLHKRTL